MTNVGNVNKTRHPAFAGIAASDWNDWRWQLRHRLRDLAGLERVFDLTAGERAAVVRLDARLPLGVTPYYAERALRSAALRTSILPALAEFDAHPGEHEDPLGEEAHHVAPGLVHTYPDKALFLVTDFCPAYCRYCMRSRLVGRGRLASSTARWERALDYLRGHPEVRDVLLSGANR